MICQVKFDKCGKISGIVVNDADSVVYADLQMDADEIIPQKLSLHFLETGIEGVYTPTKEDLQKTQELILETADNIRHDIKNNNFKANPKYFGREPACNYCAYNSICPFSLAKP